MSCLHQDEEAVQTSGSVFTTLLTASFNTETQVDLLWLSGIVRDFWQEVKARLYPHVNFRKLTYIKVGVDYILYHCI